MGVFGGGGLDVFFAFGLRFESLSWRGDDEGKGQPFRRLGKEVAEAMPEDRRDISPVVCSRYGSARPVPGETEPDMRIF